MPGLRLAGGVALALSVLALGASAASAAPATLKGTVVGPSLPDSGEGAASVRAVDIRTGVVDGTDYTAGKRDRWKLRVSPGSYALGATTVPFEGGKLVDRLLAFARARSGKTESLKLKLKRKRGGGHRPAVNQRAPARVAEGFGDVDVPFPAIWVKETEVISPDSRWNVMRKGLTEMLITDLAALRERCNAVIVERGRIGDVVNELRLQQLPGFDPDMAVPQGHLYRDNASVTTTLTVADGNITITSTYTYRRTGRSKTVSASGPEDSIFDLEQQLAAKLADVICPDTINEIGGTFNSVTDTGSVFGTGSVFSYAGNVTFTRFGPAIFGGADGFYQVSEGQYTVTASGLDVSGATACQQSGSKQYAIPAGSGSMSVSGTEPEFLEPYDYGFSIVQLGLGNTMDITLHGCPPGAEDFEGHVWDDYSVGALEISPPGTYVSDDGLTYADSHSESFGAASIDESWVFAGSG